MIPEHVPPSDYPLGGETPSVSPRTGRGPEPAQQHVVILGAGPAGVGAAYQLVKKGIARVTVLEQRDRVGGNAGSFELDGVHCDFGSHRLHPVVPPEIMEDLRQLLGPDLLFQKRRGRIRLLGRWIGFPLKPLDLLLRLPKTFVLQILADTARKAVAPRASGPENFATVLERGLGKTICREFYFPYARKLWGVEPEELATETAQRRVSGSSIGKILRKISKQIPGLKPAGAGRFYYPRRGYGQLSQCLYEAARNAGAEFKFGARFTGIERDGRGIKAVRYQVGDREFEIPTRALWSTIPVTALVRGVRPEAPPEVLAAASSLSFRAMILIYLVLDQDQYSSFDAYYLPEMSVPISRISEPKNFSSSSEPRGRTVLCAELPCDAADPEWTMGDEELGQRLQGWMERAGLPKPGRISRVVTRRLRYAYPIYRRDYEDGFFPVDRWLSEIDGVLSFGRQGLFAHDNAHHTLAMAYDAVRCLSPEGKFDGKRWAEYRRGFETHVVED